MKNSSGSVVDGPDGVASTIVDRDLHRHPHVAHLGPEVTRGYDVVADALVGAGVDTVFCVMGDGNLEVLMALSRRGVQLVHARHEQGAAGMADGYARCTGGIGVAAVTQGPGITQTATSLAVARDRHSRVLLLAGDTPASDRHHVQDLDQRAFARALDVEVHGLRAASTVRDDVMHALRRLERCPGPIVLDMPNDIQDAPVPSGASTPHAIAPVRGAMLSTEACTQAVPAIACARRPVLLAGQGALGAQESVLALAQYLGAPVVTTLRAKGVGAGHPLCLGVAGAVGAEPANRALAEADCILAIGTSLSGWAINRGRLSAHAQIIQIDRDVDAFDRVMDVDIRLAADANEACRQIHQDLVSLRLPEEPWFRVDAMPGPEAYSDGEGNVDPRRAVATLDDALPEDRVIVVDGGHFISFVCASMRVSAPRDFVFGSDFGAVGQGLGIAIGACLANRHRRVTLIAGDGGFLMGVQELETAARYKLKLNIVVLNDQGYGMERHNLTAAGHSPDEAKLATPDLAGLARGFGARGARIDCVGDLVRLPAIIADDDGPVVIDVRTNPDVCAPAAREIQRHLRARDSG